VSPDPVTDDTTAAASPDEQTHLRWEAVLAELEAATVADAPSAWTAPTDLGPVPRDLVGRASRLLAAQRDRIAVVDGARRSALEHLGALRAVDATRAPAPSVYLDASA
jgi:hypothetical protein